MYSLLKPFLPYIAIALLLVGIYTVGHIKGTSSCEIKNAKAQETAAEKDIQNHDNIEKKIMSLPDSDLDKRLARWLRD